MNALLSFVMGDYLQISEISLFYEELPTEKIVNFSMSQNKYWSFFHIFLVCCFLNFILISWIYEQSFQCFAKHQNKVSNKNHANVTFI